MDLTCDEGSLTKSFEEDLDDLCLDGIKSFVDPTLIKDERVMKNVSSFPRNSPTKNLDYFSCQSEIKVHMRKIVADWMLEVTEEQSCQPEVFHLAINYMDRFLSKVQIRKSQFQLLCCACLFLASKFKETVPLYGDKLVVYTDFSITVEEITNWELLVLSVLGWDLSIVTPYTVLDQILRRMNPEGGYNLKLIRQHAETFIALAATEYEFYLNYANPSVIAVAALMSALSGMTRQNQRGNLGGILRDIGALTQLEDSLEIVQDCMADIESSMTSRVPSTTSATSTSSSSVSTPSVPTPPKQPKSSNMYGTSPTNGNSSSSTPTDMMEISASLVC